MRPEIAEKVRRIVDRFRPDRIILFGSHAQGAAAADSDADLLVVTRIEGSRREMATEIEPALVGVSLPADVIVITPEELERNRHRKGTIIHPAVQEGKVLYAAP